MKPTISNKSRLLWIQIKRAARASIIAAAALMISASPSTAAPKEETYVEDGLLLDARAETDLCEELEDATGVKVSHITLCNLAAPHCQQVDATVNRAWRS